MTPSTGTGSRWRGVLAGLYIACFFLAFTWRGLLVYYTGDDMMNLYGYWNRPLLDLMRGNVLFWTPSYRPFGGVVYRSLFGIFGFNPYPLYVVFFAAMLLNIWLAYLVLRRLGGSAEVGALAALLGSFHGKLDYLYFNGGSLYEAFCFLFFFLGLFLYLRIREQGKFPGVGGLAAFLACLICSLNSKEMAAALPVDVLLYELIFHPPPIRRMRGLFQWVIHEGRTALLGGLLVLVYLPAKLSPAGLAGQTFYIPVYTWGRFVGNTETYLGDLLYHNAPLTGWEVAVFYALLIALALWMRSRAMWFGLLFFVIGLLPVSFVPARLGFVLYVPLPGLALYAAVLLAGIKDKLRAALPGLGRLAPQTASTSLFVITALLLAVIHGMNKPEAPDGRYSPYRLVHDQFARLYPHMERGARLLFVQTPLDYNYDLVFLLRLLYHDSNLFITQLNGPVDQRIPLERLGHYDHVFTFDKGHLVELDNLDPMRSVKLHLVKTATRSLALGEAVTVGMPGARQYFLKDVLVGDPKADGYWTLDQPELKFQLSTTEHHTFTARFFLPVETLQKTGPLIVDFYINGRYLDRAHFANAGEFSYEHEVPEGWLSTDRPTIVKMRVRNPYVSPRDGAKLGVLFRAAAFNP